MASYPSIIAARNFVALPRDEERAMMQPDHYLLGHSEAEEERLKRQGADLAPNSDAQFEKIGIKPANVSSTSAAAPGRLEPASRPRRTHRLGPWHRAKSPCCSPGRRFVADHALPQVEVREGDAYDTGLPRASFDGGHMRLVLVNVPEPERIVREMVSLVRPGGWVASFESNLLSHICDPPLPELTRLVNAYTAYSATQGI